MGKTTKKKQPPAICRLLSIQPNQANGAAPAVPVVVPPTFDVAPEHVPNSTFIVEPRVAADDYIIGAETYHTNCGLQPRRIHSLGQMVEFLSENNAHLGRVRLITHANGDDLLVPLFGQTNVRADRHTFKEHLRGFAQSDERGILSVLDLRMGRNFFGWRIGNIMTLIRNSNPALLDPFGIRNAGLPPDTLRRFMFYCCDRVMVTSNRIRRNGNNLHANEMNHLLRAVDKLIDLVAPAAPDPAGIRAFLTGLTTNQLGLGVATFPYQLPAGSLNRFLLAGRAADAVGAGFRNRLTTVRGRLDRNSTLDIRGCRAGRDTDYLRAVQEFFGRERNRPVVTGPRQFQYFGPSAHTVADNNGEIRNLIRVGANAAPNRAAFEEWADRSKINELHKTAWLTHLDGAESNILRFCQLEWRSDIPAISLDTPGLTAFASMNFRDSIVRMGVFFNIAAGDIPGGATLNTVNTFVTTKLDGYATFLFAEIDDSNKAANFTALSQIDSELGTTLVPAGAPNPLQVSHITGFQTALINHIASDQLDPVRDFMQACRTRIEDENNPGIYYYMLHIGMPVFLFRTPEQMLAGRRLRVRNNRVVVHRDFEDSAFRQWPYMLWAESLPAGNTINILNINNADARRFAMMVETSNPGNSTVVSCPHPDYMELIEIVTNNPDPIF